MLGFLLHHDSGAEQWGFLLRRAARADNVGMGIVFITARKLLSDGEYGECHILEENREYYYYQDTSKKWVSVIPKEEKKLSMTKIEQDKML